MDTLVRSISDDLGVRVVAATTTELVREACRRQKARGVAAVVLGRAATAGALLSTLTKSAHERVLVQIRGDGPLGSIVVDAWGDGRVRACFEGMPPDGAPVAVDYLRSSVAHAVGRVGSIVVTRDLGLEHRYQGHVELRSGEIDEDLQHYLGVSEQLPSALACGVVLDAHGDVRRCGGVLCQSFPGADPSELADIRDNLADGRLHGALLLPRDAAELTRLALGERPSEVTGTTSLRFHCPCDRDTAVRMLELLGGEDLRALASEQPQTSVTCHFCGEVYWFERREVEALAYALSGRVS